MNLSKAVGVCALVTLLSVLRGPSTLASGQAQQEQRFTSSSGVTLVEVVAFVSDRSGRPLTGLMREDFVLEEDGVPQDISHFSFVELPRGAAVAPEAPAADGQADVAGNRDRSGRSYVIVLDALHVDPLRSGRVKQQAAKFINDYVEPGDAVAIVTIGGTGHQTFTSDTGRLLRAVEAFVGGKPRSAALNRIDSQMRAATDGPDSDFENATKASNARTLFDSIRMICRSFGNVSGRRRSIVLFSEGIELDMTDMLGPTVTGGGAGRNASSLSSTYAADLLISQREMFDAARQSNVSLYTVDPRGTSIGADDLMRTAGPPGGRFGQPTLTPPPTRDVEREVQRSQGVLRNFADETGGFAVVNSSDFDRGFSRIVDANSTYYVLGYSPAKPASDGRYRQITVRVGRPGASVSARPGYFPGGAGGNSTGPAGGTLTLKGASPSMEALLTSALPVAGLGIQVMAAPIGLRDQDHVVAVVVELQSSDFRFVEDGDLIRNDIEVGLVAVDADGQITAGRVSSGTLRLPTDARAAVSGGLRYVLEIPLVSQRYQLRVGAVESGGGTAGSAVLDLDLAAPQGRPAPAGLVLGVYGDNVPTTGDAPVIKSLFPVLPTTSRAFTADQRLAVYVPVLGSSARSDTPVSVALTVRRPDGTVVHTSAATPARVGHVSGTSVLGSVIDLPLAGLAPGHYLLGAELSDGGRAETLAPIAFVVSVQR